MPISKHVAALRLLGTGAAVLALSTAATGSAWATDCPGGKGWDKGSPVGYKPGPGAGTEIATDRCEFSLDGTNWYASVKVDNVNLKPGDDGKVHVKVRTAGDAGNCTASLAAYRTHGPTWETSGEQVFHDWDTVAVKKGGTDTLDVSVPDAGCYAQIDLYRGNVKYDGKLDAKDGYEHGQLPKGPDRPVIKDKLISTWLGGTKDCTAQTIPGTSPSPTPSKPQPEKPTPSEPETSTPPASQKPSTPAESQSPTPTAPAESETPSNSASAASTGGSGGGDLAQTGGGNVGFIAAGAALLLGAGGAVVFVTRRRKAADANH
jgi:LPXTG-motif cell wall-anchored protein